MSFAFVLAFVTLTLLRPQEWLFTWLWNVPLLDLTFLLSIAGLVIETNERTIIFPTKSPQVYLVAGLLFAGAMSHIAHTYAAGLFVTFPLFLKPCIFTVLLIVVMQSSEKLRLAIVIIISITLLMAIHCVLQNTRGYGFGMGWPIYVSMPGREPYYRSCFYGIFGDPNDTAQMLVTAMPFAFALRRRRSFFGTVAGLCLVAVLFWGLQTTHSRGGLVAFAATATVMFFLLLPARWMPVLMTLMLVGGMLALPFSEGHMDESSHDRVAFWGQANYVFKRNFLFGVGLNMFSEYIEMDKAAHNAYVLCYTETGFFGYSFWFGLIVVGLLGAWRTRLALKDPRNEEEAWLRRFAGYTVASVVGYCVSSYFVGRAFVYPMFLMFGIMAAVPLAANTLRPGLMAGLFRPKLDLLLSTVAAAGSILYIYISILILNKIGYEP